MISERGIHCDTPRCREVYPLDLTSRTWKRGLVKASDAGWTTLVGDDGDHEHYCPRCMPEKNMYRAMLGCFTKEQRRAWNKNILRTLELLWRYEEGTATASERSEFVNRVAALPKFHEDGRGWHNVGVVSREWEAAIALPRRGWRLVRGSSRKRKSGG